MNPFEQQQQPQPPQNTPFLPPEPTPNPQFSAPEPAPAPKKRRTKLIVIIVIAAVLFIAALGAAGWFVVSSVLNAAHEQQSSEEAAAAFLSVGETPEEVYYNNVAFYQGYDATYDQTLEGENGQAAINKVIPDGRAVCDEFASGAFTTRDAKQKLIVALFATTKDSLCPQYRSELDSLVAAADDSALAQEYEDSQSYVLDGTVDVDGMMTAKSLCFVSASIYFGASETVTLEESLEIAKAACLAFMPEYETNFEYYELSTSKAAERDRLLKELATKMGLCTTLVCTYPSQQP